MSVLSIDPGEHIGVARWTDTGELRYNGSMSVLEFEDYLCFEAWEDDPPLAVPMEDYRLRQGKQMAQTGSRMITSQVIGMVKLWSHRHGAHIELQPSNILRVAAKHANLHVPAVGHIPDAVSAYLHGYWFFENQGLLRPVDRPID